MKVVCWNVQGAKKSQLRLEAGFINCNIRPGILIWLETKVNDQNMNMITRNLGFSHYEIIPVVNHYGCGNHRKGKSYYSLSCYG